ncbi:ATP-dependent DNA helicase [Mangrovibacterium diazotrophicum]|uniref:Exodeoxyribonuclease-5 n=1 Tax=Mangrovibacterium diazotrophicum TaxID=1261403 RepID=A0A419W2Q3_9BACT|nr:AAA family ATPase [Mangrovibacterium diazotrophicum]RKD89694.1 exodeoxyribonuclease-5 [Mangrovibacterium diazotrophicum]
MLKKHLENQLVDNLGFPPTEGQKYLAERLADFITTQEQDIVFLLKGYAGTGKTSMVSALVKTLASYKIQTVLLAPTGRAAKVLSTYTGKSAFTIHKRIYRQQSSSDGMGRFVLDKNLLKNCFFLVDEASMISNSSLDGSVFGTGRLLDDLYEFVYSGHNCKLMLIGDTAQLPPVGMEISPALDAEELQMYGVEVDEVELTDVVRQEMDSGILYNATALREMIGEDDFWGDYFPIELDGFTDIQRIGGGDLIEKISECYDRHGEQQTMVITRSNKRANKFNQGIRSTILYKDSEITVGDLLMVVKNNYFWLADDERLDFIANGDIVEVKSIRKYEELYGYRFADVSLRFIDYDDLEIDCKIFLDTLNIETASFGSEDNQKLFHAVAEDYMDIRSKKKRWEKIKENPHFNALQVKFAYAVTCHKAQGGQWDAVFIDQGYLVEDMLNKEFLRWLYTAFTRPVKELYLVNFNKEFFGE